MLLLLGDVGAETGGGSDLVGYARGLFGGLLIEPVGGGGAARGFALCCVFIHHKLRQHARVSLAHDSGLPLHSGEWRHSYSLPNEFGSHLHPFLKHGFFFPAELDQGSLLIYPG